VKIISRVATGLVAALCMCFRVYPYKNHGLGFKFSFGREISKEVHLSLLIKEENVLSDDKRLLYLLKGG
jgi:hypothetical protein